jgi:ABC-type sugar transport system ATPase subunit
LEELLGMTDRVLVMRRGRLAGTVDTKSAAQEALMRLATVEDTP